MVLTQLDIDVNIRDVSTDRAVLPANTRRGRTTRQGLLAAARVVFERDGYVDVRITDIAAEAGVAHGTFYAHFRGKEEVFLAVMADLWTTLLVPSGIEDTAATPYERILASNRRFLAGYRQHARLFAVVEQAATTSSAVRELRRTLHSDNAARVARAVRRWQRQGAATADVSAREAATALVSMVGRSAYYWFVVGEPHGADPAVTVSRLWARGLGIAVPEAAKRRTEQGKR